MSPDRFHIPRTLRVGDREIPEAALLAEPGLAVVLAEPGAGKTGLLDSIADQLGVKRVRASAFRSVHHAATLVVDAFDEVARIGDDRVHEILDRIRDAGADRILLSSRSGEWEDARTRYIRDLFGREPVVAQLVSLNGEEQRQIFEHLHPDRSFEAFERALQGFDLAPLLGNPEFLRLFAGAYVEADGRLQSRREAFDLAIKHLARESNPDVTVKGLPAPQQRISWANEIFAKLLLAGADGVAMGDIAEDNLHPRLATIGLSEDAPLAVLATRLFRPGAAANQHEPVHRIVAEHCAAQHLVQRIEDPSCRLSCAQTLSLIAPNGTARDDLRGLLGWIAALGSQTIQTAVIELDPYAVLSNGDPSRLTSASQIRLLDALRRLNVEDPYFRRGDRWRSFSASGFFTPDVIQAVRPILEAPDDGHLRELLLELLVGSPAVRLLRPELESVLLDETAPLGLRSDALSWLLGDDDYQRDEVLRSLVEAGTLDALRLASEILMHLSDRATYELLRRALEGAIGLYMADRDDRRRVIGQRYFVRRLIREISLENVVRLLDDLTAGLHCTCGQKHHSCHCRDGASKVVGLLLDAYFERASGPHDPARVCRWIGNLHFHRTTDATSSPAVAALQADDDLRRNLQERAFAGLATREDVIDVCVDLGGGSGHSGLMLGQGDAQHIRDLAFKTDNVALWIQFAPPHNFYGQRGTEGPNEARRHCREQARAKPDLMREWARMNRAVERRWNAYHLPRSHRDGRRRRRESRIADGNTLYFRQNRALVERGANVRWTQDVARCYLMQPDELSRVTHDLFDPEAMLRRSLRTLGGRCPSVETVGRREALEWVEIFLAGVIAEYRATGSLEAVAPEILLVVRHDTGGYGCFAEGEEDLLLAELRRHVLLTPAEAEAHARAYIEPALAASNEVVDLHALDRDPALQHLRSTLPLEWLRRYPDLSPQILERLFDLAGRHGDRQALLALVRDRCLELDVGVLPHSREAQRPFWFLRDFWFAKEVDPSVWAYMARDPKVVLWLAERRDHGSEGEAIWAPLSALKIERILITYLPHWPAVPLPSTWGTGSPEGETAYRYLSSVVWQIGRDAPSVALPVIERLLAQEITAPFHNILRSIRSDLRRRAAQMSVRAAPAEIAAALDGGPPASVEQLRALVLELLGEMQKDVRAGHSGVVNQFYDGADRLDEVGAMYRVSAWLGPRLAPFDTREVGEHQLGDRNRCDLTATRMIGGRARMLVIEGKGQWHRDLFTAAELQLSERYSMHPDADEQGIFLVIWYGSEEVVAGRKQHGYGSAAELRDAIQDRLPDGLRGRIDVFVLDVARP